MSEKAKPQSIEDQLKEADKIIAEHERTITSLEHQVTQLEDDLESYDESDVVVALREFADSSNWDLDGRWKPFMRHIESDPQRFASDALSLYEKYYGI